MGSRPSRDNDQSTSLTGIPNAAIPESGADAFLSNGEAHVDHPTDKRFFVGPKGLHCRPPAADVAKATNAPLMKPHSSIRQTLNGMLRGDLAVPGEPDFANDALSLMSVVLEPIVANAARYMDMGFERWSKKALVKFCLFRERRGQPFS